MWKLCKNALVLFLLLILLWSPLEQAQAAKGLPGSPEFGFGVTFFASSPLQEEALSLAADLRPDWLYVPVSWETCQPTSSQQPVFSALDNVTSFAAQHGIPLVFSISNAPAWARTRQGPDSLQAAQFVKRLVQRYPGQVQAIELFPRANTIAGWGAQPDPRAYLNLYRQVGEAVQAKQTGLILVAAGLQPLAAPSPTGEMDDLAFLQGLYDAGTRNEFPVISMQYAQLTGEPLDLTSTGEHRVLRHYEEVRQIMVNNHHSDGLIWITRLSLPNGSINTRESALSSDLDRQSRWLQQAALQIRSQLYIGAAFMVSLNLADDPSLTALLYPGGQHPFSPSFKEILSQNQFGMSEFMTGKPKEGSLEKQR